VAKLTEQSYINILLLVTQGQAHRTVFDMSSCDKPLNDILDTMSTLYCKKRTIMDDMKDLHNFKRKAQESIECAMGRATLLVEKIRPFYSETSWSENSERILISILKQIVSKQTRQHIEHEETKLLKLGVSLDYKTMINTVDTYEVSQDQIPTTEVSMTVNVCNSVPLDNDANCDTQPDIHAEINELKNAVYDMVEINAVRPGHIDKKKIRPNALKPHFSNYKANYNKMDTAEGTKTHKNPYITMKNNMDALEAHKRAAQEGGRNSQQSIPNSQTQNFSPDFISSSIKPDYTQKQNYFQPSQYKQETQKSNITFSPKKTYYQNF